MKFNIIKPYFISWLEATIKIWDQLLASSRASGDRVLISSTKYKVSGSKGLGRRKAHLTGLLREQKISFKLIQIPDVSEFGIKLGLVNPLLLAFGLIGRYSSEISLTRYRNRRMNKYLLHVFTQLVLHLKAGRISRFWTLAMLLVSRSVVYMVACSWKIDKNLYRTKSQRSLTKLFKEVNSLRRNFSTEMKFHRTYIPKEDTHRPLGVPSLAWRIYLNMLLHPLVLAHPLPENQHGFKPGFGTLTAWVEMFTKVLPSPNIYEGDIRQCFPSVNLLRLAVHLYKKGMPPKVLGLYHQLNMVSPEFKGAILLNENQFLLRDQYKSLLQADPSRPPMNFDMPIWSHTPEWVREKTLQNGEAALGIHGEVLLNFLDSCKDQSQYEIILEGLMHVLVEYENGTPISEFVHHADWLKYIGTAQGSPLSPYLAALALTQISEKLPEGVYILFYADDFILYGPGLNPVTLKECIRIFAEAGFTIHPNKSKWFKLQDTSAIGSVIKFLGLIFDPSTREFRAATRKGSTLIFNKEDLLSFEYDKYSALLLETPDTLWRKSRKFLGLAYSWLPRSGPLNSRLAYALSIYYGALSYFRKWFLTEFQWDLLALLSQVIRSPV